MRVILLLIGIFVSLHFCYGQNGFASGYVVKTNGDTVNGFIYHQSWHINPTSVSFKLNDAAEAQQYGLRDLKAFFVAGEYFEKATVDVDTSTYAFNDLTDSPNPLYKKSTVFLQHLFRGEKSLYMLRDETEKALYFIGMNQSFEPLVYKKYYKNPVTKVIAENQGYKGMLALYLHECADIQSKLSGTDYHTKSLTKLFHHYYDCTSQKPSYSNDRKEIRTETALLLGVSFSTIKFYSNEDFLKYLTDTDYSFSAGPSIGLTFDIKLLRSRGSSIRNDIFYSSYKINGSSGLIQNGTNQFATDAQFHFSYLKSHHLFQYEILKNKGLHVAVGPAFGFALQKDYYIDLNYTTGTTTNRELNLISFETGVAAGVGSQMKRLTVDARAELTNGISNRPVSRISRLYLLLGYRLSKT